MDEKEKEEIQLLIDTLNKLFYDIKSNGGPPEFKKFVSQKKRTGDVGLSYNNVRLWLNTLIDLKKDLEEEKSSALVNLAKEKFKKYIPKVEFFKSKVQHFIEEKTAQIDDQRVFTIYTYHEVKRTKEPLLQLGVLFLHRDDTVDYYNPIEAPVKKFSGTFKITKGNIAIVDLDSIGNVDVKMQMQIYYREENLADLFLGSYMTYHNDRIVRGSLVATQFTNEKKVESFLTGYNSNKAKLAQISPVILEFLSIRKYSYKRVPDEIYSIAALEKFLSSDFHENPEKRFIEGEKPSIIIASPNSSISSEVFSKNQSIIDKVKNSIEARFPGKLEIYIKSEQMPLDYKDAIAPPSLKYIQRTRIFFLVYTSTSKASFSLVQLGWAMAYCKQIVIIYQKDSLSDNILRLDTFKNLFTFYQIGDLQKEETEKQILGIIRRTIIGSLKEYLK
ncbi:hypothetical protein [Lewinella sp. LCG006]|uniref:hypothetical protein n=1 Tax=Lewinella sp. LCG006 TaxID=3231911 RepID=UPI0034604AEC